MIAATMEEITAACMNRSATDAKRWLQSQGKVTSVSFCQTVIGRLIEAGTRARMANSGFATEAEVFELSRLQSIRGCNALLKRQLETGAHWITDPEQFAAACRSVGLVAA